MTEMITAPQVLEFLLKAQELNIPCEFIPTDDGCCLSLTNKWYVDPLQESSHAYEMCVYLKIEGNSLLFQDGYGEYQYMNDYMDKELDKLKAEEIKEQKRKKLISRLTDEEKELLGLK